MKILVLTANEFDKDLSVKKDFVNIEGDQASYIKIVGKAGNNMEWAMVHYDVQLIGGIMCIKVKGGNANWRRENTF